MMRETGWCEREEDGQEEAKHLERRRRGRRRRKEAEQRGREEGEGGGREGDGEMGRMVLPFIF